MRRPADTSTPKGRNYSLMPMLGDVKFVDVNGDGVINDADKVECGSGIPKLEVNLNFSVAWKGFDLSGVLGSAWGHKLYNGNKYFYESMNAGSNFLTSTLDAWNPDQHGHIRAPRHLQRPQRQPQGERPLPGERQLRAPAPDTARLHDSGQPHPQGLHRERALLLCRRQPFHHHRLQRGEYEFSRANVLNT